MSTSNSIAGRSGELAQPAENPAESAANAQPHLSAQSVSLTERGATSNRDKATDMPRLAILDAEHMVCYAKLTSTLTGKEVVLSKMIQDLNLSDQNETRPLRGTTTKPNGVTYYGNHAKKDLTSVHILMVAKVKEYADGPSGDALCQMADYAELVWKKQPTRLFVPVIFLHNTIRKLWFFLIQPPKRFGHFVCVSVEPLYLKFEGDKFNTTISSDLQATDNGVEIADTVEAKVTIQNRAEFLLKVKYRGCKAMLKLAWAPVGSLLEGALYNILGCKKIGCIPKVYFNGIAIPDFFGYRLEYIIMEDCGESLYATFKKYGPKPAKENFLDSCASDVVQKVCTCLLQAARVGILHRDVSPKNITLHGGRVFLINWGYGKVVPVTPNDIICDEVISAWKIDLDKITEDEDAHNDTMSTAPFMSIRTLMDPTKNSVLDDIESVLYVVLAMISHMGTGRFFFEESCISKVDPKDQAIWKVGCMVYEHSYLKYFGIYKCSDSLRRILDTLRNSLFAMDGQYIGGDLLNDQTDIRLKNLDDISEVLGSEFYKRCTVESPEATGSVDSSGASLKRKVTETATADIDSGRTSKSSKNHDNQDDADSGSGSDVLDIDQA
ncbi:hypothetical protein LPJ53_004150 [Coemansia erecta]|uniref:Fungal-type protein kinase domain-containing protein n=1 Tax=Coemansia erecta TaxID=147472 RepID=A0A9W7XXS9_9FUNG|nr:hypothetical protein LPJ53_004150 [Coemansia erecta]